MPLTVSGNKAIVAMLNRALNDANAKEADFAAQVASAGDNLEVLSKTLGDKYSALSDSAFTNLVLGNMGVTAATIGVDAYAALEPAVVDYVKTIGFTNRGLVALQLAQILSGLEADTTYGKAAKAWNAEVQGSFEASDPIGKLTARLDTYLGADKALTAFLKAIDLDANGVADNNGNAAANDAALTAAQVAKYAAVQAIIGSAYVVPTTAAQKASNTANLTAAQLQGDAMLQLGKVALTQAETLAATVKGLPEAIAAYDAAVTAKTASAAALATATNNVNAVLANYNIAAVAAKDLASTVAGNVDYVAAVGGATIIDINPATYTAALGTGVTETTHPGISTVLSSVQAYLAALKVDAVALAEQNTKKVALAALDPAWDDAAAVATAQAALATATAAATAAAAAKAAAQTTATNTAADVTAKQAAATAAASALAAAQADADDANDVVSALQQAFSLQTTTAAALAAAQVAAAQALVDYNAGTTQADLAAAQAALVGPTAVLTLAQADEAAALVTLETAETDLTDAETAVDELDAAVTAYNDALTAYNDAGVGATLAQQADLVVAYEALYTALGIPAPIDVTAADNATAATAIAADDVGTTQPDITAGEGLADVAVTIAETNLATAQDAYDVEVALVALRQSQVDAAQADVDAALAADLAAQGLVDAADAAEAAAQTLADDAATALDELLDGATYADALAAAVAADLAATADLAAATAANTAAQADLTAAQAASTAAQAALTAATATDTAAQAAKTAAETSLAALENAVSKYEQIVAAKAQIKLIETELAALSKAVAEIAPVDALVATRKELTDAKTKALAGITELYDFNADTTVAKNEVYTAPAANANITLGKGDLLYVGGYTFNEGSAAKDGDNSVLEFFIKQVAGGVEVTFEKSVFGSNVSTPDTVVVTLTGLTVEDLEIADGFIGFGG